MLVVHMDSGLGNQMLDYSEYLAIKKSNPNKKCYIENVVYEIPNKEGMYSTWNGYELERIFSIKAPNIREEFSEKAWRNILSDVEESRFWEEGWNYAPHIVGAFAKEGLVLNNFGKKAIFYIEKSDKIKDKLRYGITKFFRTKAGYHIKRYMRLALAERIVKKENEQFDLFREYPDNSFAGHSLRFKYKGFGIEKIDAEIRQAFVFPDITDEKNLAILKKIEESNSVAIHARRSDLLSVNGHCYEHGFFKRSVSYIKKKVENPVFFFFTDEYSIGWCEKNADIFGLDFKYDDVNFITWNKGNDSYIDMQLMSQCKHNIFTESSFGFWGAYLNTNPDKITCAPDVTILATNTF